MNSGVNLVETISLELGAQEPWPNDVKLYQPYAVEQILLPDNANCLAVQAFLHMCGLPFQIEHRANAEFMSPSGKVPFIKCGAFVISELEPIVQFVANKGISLSSELDREQKSDMRAYMSIIHTVLMNAELYICWCDKKTYSEVTQIRNGSVYPWPLNHIHTLSKRSSVNKWLKIHGWFQKTLEAVYEEVEICCKALSERLEGKEYFFGNKPTELDALLYGHIFAILSTPLQTHTLIEAVMKYPNIIRHCKEICSEYMLHTSVIFTEKPDMSPSYLPVDKIFVNKTIEVDKKEINHLLSSSPRKGSCLLTDDFEAPSDSILSSISSLNTSENVGNDFDFLNLNGKEKHTENMLIQLVVNVNDGNNIKRTESRVNCSVHSQNECKTDSNLATIESKIDWEGAKSIISN